MPSPTRNKIFETMEDYAGRLKLKDAKVLEVGIAGDPPPGGNHKYFGDGNMYRTLDVLPELNPDFVADICNTDFEDNTWDLVICSQVLEHVWDIKQALKEIYRITKKSAIIDMPFMYKQHDEEGFGDYWRLTAMGMERILKESGFIGTEVSDYGNLVTALATK